MLSAARLRPYVEITRLNKPIGILLLLWPTCWALWLAAGGLPPLAITIIFLLGVVLMRSAGCIVNDICDRHFDKHVARTRLRPLAAGSMSVRTAAIFALLLVIVAFYLVCHCNQLTILLSFPGALFAATYPLLKRITHLPQLGLGVAFSWGVPMAFAAVTGEVSASAWLVFLVAALWPVIYDTMYAMADRKDDIKIGVKSTAILFGQYEVMIIAVLMTIFLAALIVMGYQFQLSVHYYFALCITAILFMRQIKLILSRDPQKCLQAFLQNNLVGMVIFAGIVAGLI